LCSSNRKLLGGHGGVVAPATEGGSNTVADPKPWSQFIGFIAIDVCQAPTANISASFPDNAGQRDGADVP
jgi:hypothetical protein